MPRTFLEQHVRPNYEEWLEAPLDERRAKNAVGDANNMAARMLRYWKDRDRTQVYGADDESTYREQLAARECPDFALLRDVAEAYKHVTLDRRRARLVTHYDQTAAEVPLWDEAQWDEGSWDGQLVVRLDDGTKRPLADIMANVIAMWERLLNRMKL